MSKEHNVQDLFHLNTAENKWVCQVKVRNTICGTKLAKCGNTSSRKLHVEAKHPHIILFSSKMNQAQKPSVAEQITNTTTPYPKDSLKYKKLNKAVLDCVIDCNLPLSIVDHPTFLAMLHAFDPRHQQR